MDTGCVHAGSAVVGWQKAMVVIWGSPGCVLAGAMLVGWQWVGGHEWG